METKKSTFQKVLTTGKKTLATVVGSALGFAAQYAIAAKKPTNADIFHRIAQQQIVREVGENAPDLDARIMKVEQGLREGYQLAKSEELRQSEYSVLITDKKTLNTLGAPKEAEGAYILSKDNKISVGDIVLPIDKNGKFIPKSYVLNEKVPENVKTYVQMAKNNSTEGIFSYAVDNKGNVLSDFTSKDEVSTGKKTLEEKVTPPPCANVKVTYYARGYVANATVVANMPNDDQTRTAPISTGIVNCSTTPTSTLKEIDDTTVAWSCDTAFQDLYGVSMSTPSPKYSSPSQGGANYSLKQ